jgi:2-polyprenyl-6-hydroxyphenyl methylase/3-demethylubiquinone-9 3-methyltransferase
MQSTERAFAFGENWKRFVESSLSSEAVTFATRSFTDLLETEDLTGRAFVDVGCGSGLCSLVAHRLGASRVVSFDIDDESVECCRELREREGAPSTWEVTQGSVLETQFLEKLGTFDVVFSWGVLHHTGAMWAALENASNLVRDGGTLAIAIYNRAEALGLYPDGRFGPSRWWIGLKRIYCRSPGPVQNLVDFTALGIFFAAQLATLRNPFRSLREYRRQRGMDLRIDIRDWLGGYPYEYAAVDEIFHFFRARGYVLTNMKYHGGLRCNEYAFRKLPSAETAPG